MNDNPYAAPRTSDIQGDSSKLDPQEQISFSGMVNRQQLRNGLRTGINWSGLATFSLISLICFAASPRSLALPWVPASLPFENDLTGEIIGVVGLGFVVVSLWHLFAVTTTWGIDSRERALLEYSPCMYDEPTTGFLRGDVIFLKQKNGEAWLSWNAVGVCQIVQDLIMIQWGNGIAGSTVFSRDMFESSSDFERAGRIFSEQIHSNQGKPDSKLQQYLPPDVETRIPSDESARAVMRPTPKFSSIARVMLVEIPIVIVRSSKPLHIYFALLLILGLLVSRQKLPVALAIGGVWLTILLLAWLLSVVQNFGFMKRGGDAASTYKFKDDKLHVTSKIAYFAIPLRSLIVDDVSETSVTVHEEGQSLTSTFQRAWFASDEQWNWLQGKFEEKTDSVK